MTARKTPGDNALDADVRDALLDAIAPLAPPPHLRETILARATRATSITDFGTVRAGANGWKELAPGITFKLLTFDAPAGIKSFLLRAAPGSRLPEHEHHEFEECLVLEGDFNLGELSLHAGDFHCAARGTAHGEARTENGVLVYLRASVGDYPGVSP